MITYGTNPGMGMGITQHIPTTDGMNETTKASFLKSLDYMGFQPGEALLGKKIDYVFLGACTNAVSYTHLDVYKRQAITTVKVLHGCRQLVP